jgi:hypothetical protein
MDISECQIWLLESLPDDVEENEDVTDVNYKISLKNSQSWNEVNSKFTSSSIVEM